MNWTIKSLIIRRIISYCDFIINHYEAFGNFSEDHAEHASYIPVSHIFEDIIKSSTIEDFENIKKNIRLQINCCLNQHLKKTDAQAEIWTELLHIINQFI